MKKALYIVMSLAASAVFANDPGVGIPYAVSCQGASGHEGQIQITSSHTPKFTLKRSYQIGLPVEFEVKSTSNRNGYFTVQSLGNVAFAGGGTLEGTLSVKHGSGLGQWTEKASVFNEATGMMEVSYQTKNVKCSIAQ